MGFDGYASGDWTVTMGFRNIASGYNAFAGGYQAVNEGDNSFLYNAGWESSPDVKDWRTNSLSGAFVIWTKNGTYIYGGGLHVDGDMTIGTLITTNVITFGSTNVNRVALETPNAADGSIQLFVTNAAYNISGFLGTSNNMQSRISINVSNSAASAWAVGFPTGTRFGGATNALTVSAGKWAYVSFHLIPGQMTNAVILTEY
jgi:hypothetical protein